MAKIAILLNHVADAHDPAAADVLIQCREIAESLTRLGHTHDVVPCTLDLASVGSQLIELQPDLVFNLVESLDGTDRLMPVATLLLDAMQLRYTGAGTQAILSSGDKLRAKAELSAAGIATPAWYDPGSELWLPTDSFDLVGADQLLIIKAVHEHASFEIDNGAVRAFESDTQLQQTLDDRCHTTRREHFAEQFVPGREFNLSILEIEGIPQVLSPAEIDFSDLPADLPRIVGASAKWDEDSVEYRRTPRRFEFPDDDAALLNQLCELAKQCWALFGLSGYGRVDFRVDPAGCPYVLEINANPCLSRDAGFVAAAARSQISYDELIEFILLASERPISPLRRLPLGLTAES